MITRISLRFESVLIMFFCLACCGSKGIKNGSPVQVVNRPLTIAAISKYPDFYVDSLVTVSGLLINLGKNYFKDLRVVLKDSTGNSMPVTIWVPLEMPPLTDPSIPRPKILIDYLGKQIEVKGYLRHDKTDRYSDYEYYLEVEQADILLNE